MTKIADATFKGQCKAPEILDTVLHKIHAASPRGVWAART